MCRQIAIVIWLSCLVCDSWEFLWVNHRVFTFKIHFFSLIGQQRMWDDFNSIVYSSHRTYVSTYTLGCIKRSAVPTLFVLRMIRKQFWFKKSWLLNYVCGPPSLRSIDIISFFFSYRNLKRFCQIDDFLTVVLWNTVRLQLRLGLDYECASRLANIFWRFGEPYSCRKLLELSKSA